MEKMNEIYLKILGIYVLIITIVGTIFNTLTIYICRKVKQNSLFTFYQFYNFFSTIGMYYWNLNYFVMAYGPYPDLFLTTWPCRIGTYIQFICLQLIGWNIVSETIKSFTSRIELNFSLYLQAAQCIDRYLQVRFQKWRKHYFGGKRPFYTMVGLSIIIALFNSNVLFTYGYIIIDANNSITYVCHKVDGIPETQWMGTWHTVII